MSKQRIVEIVREILSNQTGIVDGCRAICRARVALDDNLRDNEILFPFIAFDSEMDTFPSESSRKHWNSEALKEKDKQLEMMLTSARPEILEACRRLLAQWS